MELNAEQLAAVQHPPGSPALLLASAGAGKTASLTARIVWLIDKQLVTPKRILALTFTNRAANEIRERVMKALPHLDDTQSPRLTTIHSLALSMIRRNPPAFGLPPKISPLDDYDQSQIMKRIVTREKWEDSNPWKILEQVEFHRSRGVGFARDYTDEVHEEAKRIYDGYHALRPVDIEAWKLFENEKQCQPPGTMVTVVTKNSYPGKGIGTGSGRGFRLTETEQIPIEKLKDGDKVVTWDKKEDRTRYGGRSIRVASKPYSGPLVSISSGGNTTKVTPDHWVWARFNDKVAKKHFVYLMYREDYGFRVGVAKFKVGFTSRKHMGLSGRMSGNKASKAWVLRFCEDQFEARCWEAVYSYRYGIPQTIFEVQEYKTGHRSHPRYQELIDLVYKEVKSEGARLCLKDHGLLEDHPMLSKGPGHFYSHSSSRYFKVAASNLHAEFMSMPPVTRHRWEGKGNKQRQSSKVGGGLPIDSLTVEHYEGPVYSLDVEKDHTYVADGLIVGNCIGGVDFMDMIHLCIQRNQTDQAWREALWKVYDHVLLDECQDTSKTAWTFINTLLGPDNYNFMPIGDCSQAIYSFIGARPALIHEYAKDWKGITPTVYKLTKNHRSIPEIVRLANRVQHLMPNEIPMKMVSYRGDLGETGTTNILTGETPEDIALEIVREIRNKNIPYKDCCLLMRSGIQLRDIEGAFIRARIPYVVRGGKSLLQTEEVRDILSYIRLATNPKDFSALARASSMAKGVGDAKLESIRKVAQDKYEGDLINASKTMGPMLGNLVNTVTMVSYEMADPIAAIQAAITHSGYVSHVQKKYAKDKDRIETKLDNLLRLKDMIRGLMDETDLTIEDLIFQMTMDKPEKESPEGCVMISTIHSAKGLEWHRVWVLSVVEKALPHWRSANDDEISEERRVWYVAATRARDHLTICVPSQMMQGKYMSPCRPSRFLVELGLFSQDAG